MLVSAATLILAIAPAAPPTPALAGAADTVVITEWLVPYEESRPRDPYVAPDGRVWFVGQRTDYVAVFDPNSDEFERFDLPEGAGPHNLIVDSDGTVWYAGNRAAHIGKLDPVTGEIEQVATPDPPARDPHTLVFAPDGNIWFTVQGGNVVGHLQTTTGEMRIMPVGDGECTALRNRDRPERPAMDRALRHQQARDGRYRDDAVDRDRTAAGGCQATPPGAHVGWERVVRRSR